MGEQNVGTNGSSEATAGPKGWGASDLGLGIWVQGLGFGVCPLGPRLWEALEARCAPPATPSCWGSLRAPPGWEFLYFFGGRDESTAARGQAEGGLAAPPSLIWPEQAGAWS